MNELDDADRDALEGIIGKRIESAHSGDGGLHIGLDDGRTLVILGIMAILNKADERLH